MDNRHPTPMFGGKGNNIGSNLHFLHYAKLAIRIGWEEYNFSSPGFRSVTRTRFPLSVIQNAVKTVIVLFDRLQFCLD